MNGVFAPDGERLRFHPAGRLTCDDGAEVVAVAACGSRSCVQWANNTTQLRFEPVALVERLAVIPRPRIDLVLYYGISAPRAPWRPAVVASAG